MPSAAVKPARKKRSIFKKYWQLYIMLLIPLVHFILFKYGPMLGVALAFRRYRPGGAFWGVSWVRGDSGEIDLLYYFRIFLRDAKYWQAFANTLVLSLLNIVVNFPFPVIFAILINEIKREKFKKFVQTISYAPRFMSTVVVISFMAQLLMPNSGIVNKLMGTNIDFVGTAGYFKWLYVFTDTWQYTGFTAIIYLAAITGINQELYEAAQIDGAGRIQQIMNVTVPGILPTVMVMLILNIGRLLTVGFEKVLLLYRPSNAAASMILDKYVWDRSIGAVSGSNYSLATAAGLFTAIICTAFVVGSNYISKKTTGSGIY